MATELSTLQWIEILQNPQLTKELDLEIFQALYAFEEHKAPASHIGRILGFTGKNPAGPLNLEVGRYAKRIAQLYDIDFTERQSRQYKYWDIFFDGWDEPPLFIWKLRENLKLALETIEKTDDTSVFPEELTNDEVLTEGLKRTIQVNSYERNSKARRICIEYWKPICSVCNFNFENMYGELGRGFIHIHHLKQISEIGREYQIDPIEDLRPVCPNCHSMLHKKTPPLTIEELQEIIGKYSKQIPTFVRQK